MSKALRLYKVTDCIPKIYGKYRYLMSFEAKKTVEGGRSVAVILMNPSIAGYVNGNERIDSTLGKVLCWCHKNNFSKVDILNLFAFRETYPTQLKGISYSKLVGPKNNETIKNICRNRDVVIAAWGDCEGISPSDFAKRTDFVIRLNGQNKLHYVGELTLSGNPRHGRSWNCKPILNEW